MSNTKGVKVGDKVRYLSHDGYPWGPELTVVELTNGVSRQGTPMVYAKVEGPKGTETHPADHFAVGMEMYKERPLPMSVKRVHRVDAELGPLRIKADRESEKVTIEMDTTEGETASIVLPYLQFCEFVQELAGQATPWE